MPQKIPLNALKKRPYPSYCLTRCIHPIYSFIYVYIVRAERIPGTRKTAVNTKQSTLCVSLFCLLYSLIYVTKEPFYHVFFLGHFEFRIFVSQSTFHNIHWEPHIVSVYGENLKYSSLCVYLYKNI